MTAARLPDPEHLPDHDRDEEDHQHRHQRPDLEPRCLNDAVSDHPHGDQRQRDGNNRADKLAQVPAHEIPHADFPGAFWVTTSPAIPSDESGSSWSNARPAVAMRVGSSLVGSQTCRARLRSSAARTDGSRWVPAYSCSSASASLTV